MATDTRSENGKRNGGTLSVEQHELIRLLCRAATRLAVAAQGIDDELDEQLAAMRQLLRRESVEPHALAALIDTIDERIKLVDDERDRRADIVQRELHKITAQLLAVKPAGGVTRELKKFQKKLKDAFEEGRDAALLSELASLQAQVLTADTPAKTGLLGRWFGASAAASAAPEAAEQSVVEEVAPVDPPATAPEEPAPMGTEPKEAAPEIPAAVPEVQAVALDDDAPAPPVETEPPFTRISAAVCKVLNDLLHQIEPPPNADENYRHACDQVARGLNWYELVSTLEEVSVIVLAALQRGEGEFQQFLQGLNQRLIDFDTVVQASRQQQQERRDADSALNESVRMEVEEMHTQVVEATELEQLKAEVRVRLESVVDAMDRHRESERERQRTLEHQLDALVERVREMETQSATIEQRMVEQRQLALLDPLTQLPNRQAYEECLQREYQRWQRYGRPLTLAVCDVDNFKSVNDSYGHLAGDKVLRIIARTLRNRLRKTDFIARFGGEEFVILMPETEAPEALRTLETIRLAVANCPFHFRERPITITVSAGVAAFAGTESPEAIFERADAALYRAKQAGRNCCLLHEADADAVV